MKQTFSVKTLFLQRVADHFRQLKALCKTAIDWIVWLYVILPVLVIGGYNYWKWWRDEWDLSAMMFPIETIIFAVLFLLMAAGSLRFFIERADQLFLRQYHHGYRQLKKLGVFYSATVHFIILVVVFAILAPLFLVQLEKNIAFLVALFFLCWSGSLLIPAIRQLLQFRFRGWRYYIMNTIFMGSSAAVYWGMIHLWDAAKTNQLLLMAGCLLIIFTLTWFVLVVRMHKTSVFLDELANEITLKYRFMSTMLMSAGMVGAPQFQQVKTAKSNKRPWFFRKSGTIFSKRTPEKVIIELHMKYLLRNKHRRMLMLQLTGTCLFALLILPSVLKWIVWFIAIIMFLHLNNSYVVEMKRNTFLRAYDWEREKLALYTRKSVFWTNFPCMTVIGIVAGAVLFPWWGIVAVGSATFGISYLLQPLLQK